jgi:hypothetical protein
MTERLLEARATTPNELQEIDLAHDAYFDPDDVAFDDAAQA